MKKCPVLCLVLLLALLAQSGLADGVPVSLLFEARSSAYRAGQWLLKQQQEDGSWQGNPQLTAVVVKALCELGLGKKNAQLVKATEWLAHPTATAKPLPVTGWEQEHDRAAALAACAAAGVALPKAAIHWRTALLQKLMDTQKGDGFWQDKGEDSLAATAHALCALALAGGDELLKIP